MSKKDLSINFCLISDIPLLQNFIKNEWKNNHIFVKSEALLSWQYRHDGKRLNIVNAYYKNNLVGFLGYIPSTKFDSSLENKNTLWLAMWKTSDQCKIVGLGLKMLKFLTDNIKHNAIAVNGINHKHDILYKALGYKVNNLKQFYCVNSFKLLKDIKSSPHYYHPKVNKTGSQWQKLGKKELLNIERSNLEYSSNYKSAIYLINRYLENPFYDYSIYKVTDNNFQNFAILVTRVDTYKETNILRIVDFFGNEKLLSKACFGLGQIMNETDSEYCDFWNYGINEKYIKKLGFKLVDFNNKETIIPSYFEPFESININLKFAYKLPKEENIKFIVCKGDGDQDRPNKIKIK